MTQNLLEATREERERKGKKKKREKKKYLTQFKTKKGKK